MSETTTRTPIWTLGDRLVKSRHMAGYSQSEMAELLGIARRSITRYEVDLHRPTKAVLLAWAVHTNVPLDWLETGRTQDEGQSTWIDWLPDFMLPQLVAS